MKRFVIKQAGLGEAEYIRQFVLEIPDDWDERDVEGVILEDLETEDGQIEWQLDYSPSAIAPNRHTVSRYDEDDWRCRRLPVMRLVSDLNMEYYTRQAAPKAAAAEGGSNEN